ncbi:hypothetical protein SDC9_129868 [bioreactor metagenome]|uniref:Pyridoxamine 5'-phosphate oxidase putative domain-containing protein n=1 Tax=bioreactor metagenome TaxID=1076179 RepID=A0A645D066_9ZZZZ
MFNDMRRSDRALSQEETEDILATGIYGVLSMVGTNEYGYGIPLSYVYKNNSIYIHTALTGQKLSFLRDNNKVSFNVVTEAVPLPDAFSMRYKSAIVFGKISEIAGEEKLSAIISLVEKYATADIHIIKGKEKSIKEIDRIVVLRLDIEHLTGKARK